MGSEYQEETIEEDVSVERLKHIYAGLVEQAEWDYGHSGYTGTFAEKPDLEIIEGDWDVHDAEEDCNDNNDKWGASFAYHLKGGGWYIGGRCSC